MSFVIDTIEARVVDHAVRQEGAIVSSLGRHVASRYLVVTVRSTDGAVGYGEGTTAPIWSGESAETAQWMIEEFMRPLLVGQPMDHPSEAVAILDRHLHANSFGKAAVDIALW